MFGDHFQREAEAKIENEEDSGQNEPEWQMIRRRRAKAEKGQGPDEVSLKNSDSPVNLIRCDSLCQDLGRRKKTEDRFEGDRRKREPGTPEREQDNRREEGR